MFTDMSKAFKADHFILGKKLSCSLPVGAARRGNAAAAAPPEEAAR